MKSASRPTWRSAIAIASVTIAVLVYLFVTAPPPLAATSTTEPASIPIHRVFAMLEAENDAARALWTSEIVEKGKSVGLAFEETWREPTVEAGPLPALFLRETARELERRGERLSLFLGSRFPINAANKFSGPQLSRFSTLEARGEPQVFFDPTSHMQTGMFSDRAVVEACVQCHNEHRDSPKRDWTTGAIMGATTWMYPDDRVSVRRALALITALRSSIRSAYSLYIEKVGTFARPPSLGARWPRDGYALPTADVFMGELARRTSQATLGELLGPI
jgi:adenylate cyclase